MSECDLCGYPVGSVACNKAHNVLPEPVAPRGKPYAYYYGNLLVPVNYVIENSVAMLQEEIDDLLETAVKNMTAERIHTGIKTHRDLGHAPKTVKITISLTLE